MGHLFAAKVAGQTVKLYLAAVRHTQIALGLGDLRLTAMPQLEYVTKGYKKSVPNHSRTRLPITPPILSKLRAEWEKLTDRKDATMLWAASCMCFFGFLRMGEVICPSDQAFDPETHLAFGDVRVNDVKDPQFLEVRLKASKTDPFRLGVTVYLGQSKSDICPVAAILAYSVLRGSAPGPFFQFADGRALTRARFVEAIRQALAAAGVDAQKYSGHSFRIGAATTAAAKGLPDSLIKTLGRWQSAAYTVYVRTPREQLCRVAQTLCA